MSVVTVTRRGDDLAFEFDFERLTVRCKLANIEGPRVRVAATIEDHRLLDEGWAAGRIDDRVP